MRRLMLLRHAKTETDAPSGHDRDRRLDDRGHFDAAEIGRWIGTHPPFPDGALVSTAVRARQTWEIAREAMREQAPPPPVDFLEELYGAEPEQLMATIRAMVATDPERLLLVGHNPGLHELALLLINHRDDAGRQALAANLPTAGLVILDFAIEDWGGIGFGRARFVNFVTPKLIRASGD